MKCVCGRHLIAGDWHGVVETKCPTCSRIATFGSGMTPSKEVRCIGQFRGNQGGWCGHLICRISVDLSGTISYVCRKCGDRRSLTLTPQLVTST